MRFKITIFMAFLTLFPIFANARSHIISPIPAPSETILDISDKECSESCLKKLYNKKLYFSFLAKFNPEITDKKLLAYLQDAREKIRSISSGEETKKGSHFKVALLIPKQIIGRYSVTITNTIMAYLMAKNIDFEFEVFDCINENPDNIKSTYNKISKSGTDFIIAILTQQGVQDLVKTTNIAYPTYIPAINKERIQGDVPNNLYFGGISYKDQIDLLQTFIKDSSVIQYNDDSQIGAYLSSLISSYNFRTRKIRTISSQDASRFKRQLEEDERFLENSVLFLNTSASKSGLILSQLSYFEKEPKRFLSTQINFNRTLLQLAPPKNRNNLFVVSSIGKMNSKLVEYALLLNSDLKYDWVSYSTALGVEFGLGMVKLFSGLRFFKEPMRANQVEYQNYLYTTSGYNFVLVK